jgi:iduronate 2-sulfatase
MLSLPLLLVTTLLITTLPSIFAAKNILFIAVDDLRPEHGAFGGAAITPNIDAFAKTATRFNMNNVQIGVCSPSRTSLLTGRYPDYTHITDLYTYFRDANCNVTTLPQYFRENGFQTLGSSKIFHPGHASGLGDYKNASKTTCGAGCAGYNDPPSWDNYFIPPSNLLPPWSIVNNLSWHALDETLYPISLHPDSQSAAYIAAALASSTTTPFFFAAGFLKPHLPFLFPAHFLDPYVAYNTLAPDRFAAVNESDAAWTAWGELSNYADIKPIAETMNLTLPGAQMPISKALELRRGYLAATSYNDWCVGQVLDALDASGKAQETVVVLWGDHGWQLGDHSDWTKQTNFESVVRAPLLIRSPDHPSAAGAVVNALTQHIDIAPTLVELLGLPPLSTFQGESLVPLLLNPSLPALPKRGAYAYSQFPRDDSDCSPPAAFCAIPHSMGYTIRSPEWRYTEWVKYDNVTYTPKWGQHYPGPRPDVETIWHELYDHRGDVGSNWQDFEHVNVAEDPANAAVIATLSAALKVGPNIVRG